jgi:HEAT repeat protein
MVLAMRLEMILQLLDALAEDGDLDFWRAGVSLMNSVLRNYLSFRIGRQGHARIDTPRLSLISFCTTLDYHKLRRAAIQRFCHLLGDLNDPRGIAILVRLLTDRDVKYMVPSSPDQIGDRSAIAPLITSLKDPDPNMRVFSHSRPG